MWPHQSNGLPTIDLLPRCRCWRLPAGASSSYCLARTRRREALRRISQATPRCHDGSRQSSDIWRRSRHVETARSEVASPRTNTHLPVFIPVTGTGASACVAGLCRGPDSDGPFINPARVHLRLTAAGLGMKGSDDPGELFFFFFLPPARPHHLDSTTSRHPRPAGRLRTFEKALGRTLEG